MHISLVHWIFIVAALAVCGVRFTNRTADWRIAGLVQWLAITALAMCMMTSSSAFIWEAIPVASYIQFPWRLFMLLSISGAALGALLTSIAGNRRAQAAILILTVGLQMHLYHRRLKPRGYTPLAEMNIDDPKWRDTPEARKSGFYEEAYDPIGVARRPSDDIGRWTILESDGTIVPQLVADDALRLASRSDTGMRLRIHIHAFPGWSAQIDEREARIERTPQDGYMEILVPPGAHRIALTFTNTPVRTVANAISAGSATVLVLLCGGLGVREVRRRRNRQSIKAQTRRVA
jgi:hypothetical protein